jgi:hypothetical protein
MGDVTSRYSHDVMETIKIETVIDGDLAATLLNFITFAEEEGRLDGLLFCGHVIPKLEAFWELLKSKTDIENRVE